jgi:hypothetical protein
VVEETQTLVREQVKAVKPILAVVAAVLTRDLGQPRGLAVLALLFSATRVVLPPQFLLA